MCIDIWPGCQMRKKNPCCILYTQCWPEVLPFSSMSSGIALLYGQRTCSLLVRSELAAKLFTSQRKKKNNKNAKKNNKPTSTFNG